MGVLNDLSAAAKSVVQKTGPSVVGVGEGWGLGSGLVIGEGLVLTNAHNLYSKQLTVRFPGGRSAPAEVAGVDLDGDIAILRVDTGDVRPLEWSSVEPDVGTALFALSNPGGGAPRISFGLVTSVGRSFRGPRGRRIAGSIEHTAPLPKGASGGPVVDSEGNFLALNTHRLGEGFYMALPADEALRARVDSLSSGNSVVRPRLGVELVPPSAAGRLRRAVGLDDRQGFLIRGIEDDGAAARAGLKSGDLIIEIAGTSVSDFSASGMSDLDKFYEMLDGIDPGGSLDLRVLRGTEELGVTVSFA